MRYVGIVSRVNRGGTSGFIASQSVMREFGSRMLKPDIFVHNDDCDKRLFKGAYVTFDYAYEAEESPKKRVRFRARNVTVETCRPGVEIHFDTTQPISHPEVEARLCYSPLMHRKRIEYLAKGWGFAIVLIAWHEDQAPYTNRCFVEVFGAEQTFRFVRFSRPGKWTARALLLALEPSKLSLNRSQDAISYLQTILLGSSSDYQRRGIYLSPLDDILVFGDPQHALQYPGVKYNWPRENDDSLFTVAMSEVAVEIPEGIFAKEKPQWLKDYATYFMKAGPADECRFRQRYLLMVVQTPAWFLIEFAKRVMHGVWALAQTLDMRQGGWQNLLGTLRPTVRFTPMVPDRTRNDDGGYRGRLGLWRTRYGWAYTPLAALLAVTLFRLVTKTVIPAAVTYAPNILNIILVFVAIVVSAIAYVLLSSGWAELKSGFKSSRKKAGFEKAERRLAAKEARREANIQEAIERAQNEEVLLVCGGEAPRAFSFAPLPGEMNTWKGRLAAFRRAITLEPVPEAQRTATLRFQAVKRVVCAPFQR